MSMGGMKKLASSLALRKLQSADGQPPKLPQGHNVLKRTNAKLRKRSKGDHDVPELLQADAEGKPSFSRRFMRSFVGPSRSNSRVNSFDTGQSVVDFEVDRLEQRLPPPIVIPERFDNEGPIVSKHGLKVDTDALRARAASAIMLPSPASERTYHPLMTDSPVSVAFTDLETRSPGLGRDVHRRRTLSVAQTNPFSEAAARRDSWEASRSSVAAQSLTDVLNSSSPPRDLVHTPDALFSGSRKLPAIRDIDWNNVTEEQMELLRAVYGAVNPWLGTGRPGRVLSGASKDGLPSPADSGIGGVNEPGQLPYTGKGKAFVVEEMSPLQELERAMRQWLVEEEASAALEDRIISEDERQQRASMLQQLHQAEEKVDADSSAKQELQEWIEEVETLVEQSEREAEDRRQAEILVRQQEEEREAEDRRQAEILQEELRLEEEARIAAEKARLRDCNVCGDAKDPLEFDAKAPTSTCEHPATTCKECLESWMASEFDTKGTDGIICPECPQELNYHDVQRAASPTTFHSYDKMATRNALAALDDFAWCLGPSCDNGQLNYENSNYMDCQICKYKQCLKHKVPWHSNETCDQYEYRTSGQKARDEERKTEKMLDECSKKCPGKNCGWRIQKTDGCDHMTCKKCRFEFCWQCLASQKEIKRVGNTAHQSWCKFHSTNLDVAWPFNVH